MRGFILIYLAAFAIAFHNLQSYTASMCIRICIQLKSRTTSPFSFAAESNRSLTSDDGRIEEKEKSLHNFKRGMRSAFWLDASKISQLLASEGIGGVYILSLYLRSKTITYIISPHERVCSRLHSLYEVMSFAI